MHLWHESNSHGTTQQNLSSFDMDCSTKTNHHSSSRNSTNWNNLHFIIQHKWVFSESKSYYMRLANIKEILMLQSRKIIQKTKFTQEALLFEIPIIKHWSYFSMFCQSQKTKEMWFMMQLYNHCLQGKKIYISVLQDVFTYGSWSHHSLKSSYSDQFHRKKTSLFFVLLQNMVLYIQICLHMLCSIGFNL